MGSLSELSSGMRQGSQGYNLDRVNAYIKSGGENVDFARNLRSEILGGTVESFASFNRSDKLVQFDLSYAKSANFKTDTGMFKVVPRK